LSELAAADRLVAAAQVADDAASTKDYRLYLLMYQRPARQGRTQDELTPSRRRCLARERTISGPSSRRTRSAPASTRRWHRRHDGDIARLSRQSGHSLANEARR
jgi:hypothetical protein